MICSTKGDDQFAKVGCPRIRVTSQPKGKRSKETEPKNLQKLMFHANAAMRFLGTVLCLCE